MKIQVEKPSRQKLDELKVFSWPLWTKSESEFEWSYESKETCYFLEGEVTVRAPQQTVSFGKGDLVIFPQGLTCTWQVKKPVKKHYLFE